ncbi:hypothetical protein BJV78DRAFT_1155156 [Lactifluus subvellereus]|nr:hypothetical protein BJV78DRAFT_1155156 [Lactifluus subvellereus]
MSVVGRTSTDRLDRSAKARSSASNTQSRVANCQRPPRTTRSGLFGPSFPASVCFAKGMETPGLPVHGAADPRGGEEGGRLGAEYWQALTCGAAWLEFNRQRKTGNVDGRLSIFGTRCVKYDTAACMEQLCLSSFPAERPVSWGKEGGASKYGEVIGRGLPVRDQSGKPNRLTSGRSQPTRTAWNAWLQASFRSKPGKVWTAKPPLSSGGGGEAAAKFYPWTTRNRRIFNSDQTEARLAGSFLESQLPAIFCDPWEP